MRKYTLFGFCVLFLLVFFVSCKKSSATSSSNNSQTVNIKYSDISPDVSISSSIRTGSDQGCTSAPLPLDSSIYYYLDVDSDALYDFKFESKTTYNHFSNSSPCGNYDYQILISSLSPNYLVGSSFSNRGMYSTSYNVMNDSAMINNSIPFSASLFVSGATRSQPNGFPIDISLFSGDKFIAFKKQTNAGNMYGWIRVFGYNSNKILIKDFAYSLTPGSGVFCNQKN